jgi:hypothetical protein
VPGKVNHFFIQTGKLRQGRMRFQPAFLLDKPSAFQYQAAIFSQGRLPRGL